MPRTGDTLFVSLTVGKLLIPIPSLFFALWLAFIESVKGAELLQYYKCLSVGHGTQQAGSTSASSENSLQLH